MAVLSDAQREAGWTIAKLGDIAPLTYGKSLVASKRIPGDVPVYSSAGLIDSHNESIIDGQNIIIGRKGTIGSITWSEGPAYPIDTTFYTAGTEKVNIKYLYYLLKTYKFSEMNTDSAVPGLNRVTFESQEAVLPPLEEQERIAGILGSLDDKIEANTRLIQTMEDYVHTMIKKISKSDSVKRVAIKDLAVHEKNQELPREHVDGVIHHYSLPAYDSGKTPGLEEANSIKSNKFITDKPCVLFSKLNPGTPRIWLVNPEEGVKSYASTEFIVLTPKENVDIANLWAACSEERISQNLADMASGTSTSHQRVRPTDILNSKILDLSNQSEIRSITSYIEALRKENLQLAETRDALIKRLIG